MTDLTDLFAEAAMTGRRPARSEIDKITIDDDLSQPEAALFRRNLIDRLDDVADLRAQGANGPARQLGKRLATEMADQTAAPTPADLPDDPGELAALVHRSGEPGRGHHPERTDEDPRSLAARTRHGQRGR